jgi:hypothetical protein
MTKKHETHFLLHTDCAWLLIVGITLYHLEQAVDADVVGHLLFCILALSLWQIILQVLVLLIRDRRMHTQHLFITHPDLLGVFHLANALVDD